MKLHRILIAFAILIASLLIATQTPAKDSSINRDHTGKKKVVVFSNHQEFARTVKKLGLIVRTINLSNRDKANLVLPRGCTTVTPVRTGPLPTTSFPDPEISVVCPTSTPLTSVIASRGPGVPSSGMPRSRARGFV